MPRKKQVKRLETLNCHTLALLVAHSCYRIDKQYSKVELQTEDPLNWITGVHQNNICITAQLLAVITIKHYLVSGLPHYIYDEVVLQILTVLSETNYEWHNGTFLEAVLHSRQKHLTVSLRHWNIMKHLIFHLDKLQGLEHLDLTMYYFYHQKTSNFMATAHRQICYGLHFMDRLTRLMVMGICTDWMLKIVSLSCPNLQFLDASSPYVSDTGLESIHKCQYLQHLELWKSNASYHGITHLLEALPGIVHIIGFQNMGAVLLSLQSQCPKKQFQLKEFHASSPTCDQMKLLPATFPTVKEVTLCNPATFRVLQYLTQCSLRQLQLYQCRFTVKLFSFFQVCGSQLTLLTLQRVLNVNNNALVGITEHCPNLTILRLYNCEFVDSGSVKAFARVKTPLPHLEKLSVEGLLTPAQLQFLLSGCQNIRIIDLGYLQLDMCDSAWTEILKQNRLQKLEELLIRGTTSMTMGMLRHLLVECDCLRRLGYLQEWGELWIENNLCLLQEVREMNLDLEILSKKYVY